MNPATEKVDNTCRGRGFQFSVRSLLVVLTVLAIALAWLAAKRHRARRQHAAAEALADAGAVVYYDYHVDPDGAIFALPDDSAKPDVPRWLLQLLGRDFFSDVVIVEVHSNTFSDKDMVHIKELRRLQRLEVFGTQVTDSGLLHVSELHDLEELNLAITPITDGGLRHLTGLRKLQYLHLPTTQVTEEGVRYIQTALPNCEVEYLKGSLPIVPSGL